MQGETREFKSKQTQFAEILSEPPAFFRYFMNSQPYPYQTRFLQDQNPEVLFVSGRQVGKTTMLAAKALHHAILNPSAQAIIISRSQRQSNILFQHVLNAVNHSRLTKYVSQQTQTQIRFKNNSLIVSLPCGRSGDTSRGYSPTLLIFDEAAFIPNDVFAALRPSTAASKAQRVYSTTPLAKTGFVYQLWANAKNVSRHHVPSTDCPRIPPAFLESERDLMTEAEFNREYLGEFLSQTDNWLPAEEVHAAVNQDYYLALSPDHHVHNVITPASTEHDFYLGIDPARFGLDDTVFTVSARTKEGAWTVVETLAVSKSSTPNTIGHAKELAKKWGVKRIYVDANGLGGGSADLLKEAQADFSEFNAEVRFVNFTLEEKDGLYRNLKRLFEKKLITIPDCRKLVFQLTDLEYEFSSNGRVKVHHPEVANAHDDFCFVAGTRILTKTGQKPIERIQVGDMVLTREGFKRVVKTGSRLAQVVEKFGLVGTPSHPVFTKTGIKPLSLLTQSDVTYIWNEKQCSIEERPITDIRLQNGDNYAFITGITASGKKRLNLYTDKFGKIIAEKFRLGSSFITKIEIPRTTNLKTLRLCRSENTSRNIIKPLKEERKREETSLNMRGPKQPNGIILKKGANGIGSTPMKAIFGKKNICTLVWNADKNTTRREFSKQNIAQTNAYQKPVLNQGKPRNTTEDIVKKRKVYNLQVEDAHEY
ncbi:Hint domain-containing protein, partial [Candidatus Micrarchaeota archaeon]|nr:Hint domain-containing protein [Candidatus Micrarchaeota archaeon]